MNVKGFSTPCWVSCQFILKLGSESLKCLKFVKSLVFYFKILLYKITLFLNRVFFSGSISRAVLDIVLKVLGCTAQRTSETCGFSHIENLSERFEIRVLFVLPFCRSTFLSPDSQRDAPRQRPGLSKAAAHPTCRDCRRLVKQWQL